MHLSQEKFQISSESFWSKKNEVNVCCRFCRTCSKSYIKVKKPCISEKNVKKFLFEIYQKVFALNCC